MIANPDNRHKKREREKTGSGHPQPHCALSTWSIFWAGWVKGIILGTWLLSF